MPRKKQSWKIGDAFSVETEDGRNVLGQIVGQEPRALNSVTVVFFDFRFERGYQLTSCEGLQADNIFSAVFTTRDLLDSGVWKIIGHFPIDIPQELRPNESLRDKGFVGAKVIGSGVITEFLNAFYALRPWDDWKKPDYLDSLLVGPEKKPAGLIYKTSS
jgi:hypothetical protein